MSSPFPGMDPYLEQSAFWSSFHSRLIVAIADALAPQLLPKYYIEVETRTYSDGDEDLMVGIPDGVVYQSNAPQQASVPSIGMTATQIRPQKVMLPILSEDVKERYLEVRETETNLVIVVIEVISPKNKRSGSGRTAFEYKRENVLKSQTHWVEIDLLRSGKPMAMKGNIGAIDYRILISRSDQRPVADLYGFTLRDTIPVFPLPLKQMTESVSVDLQEIFMGIYDRAGYQVRLNYRDPIPPPMISEQDQLWIDEILNSRLRS